MVNYRVQADLSQVESQACYQNCRRRAEQQRQSRLGTHPHQNLGEGHPQQCLHRQQTTRQQRDDLFVPDGRLAKEIVGKAGASLRSKKNKLRNDK